MASVSCTLPGTSAALAGFSQTCSAAKPRCHASPLPTHKSFLGQCSPLLHAPKAVRSVGQTCRGVPVAKIREIFMPALSSTMTEGKIVSWLKSEGDKVSKGDSVVVVESDKADMDVETFYDGYLAALVIDEGEVAPVGSPIGLLADTEAEIDEAKEKAKGLSGGSAPAAPPPPAEAEAPPPPPAPTADMAAPPPPAPAAAAAPPPPPPPAAEQAPPSSGRIVATPYAKKLAKKYKIELTRVTGTGNYGRITASDVETAANGGSSTAAPVAPPAAPAPVAASAPSPAAAKPAPAPAAAAPALGTTVPFTGMQNAVANNMNASLAVPTFRVGYTITTDALDALYKQIKSKGVTMTALLAKATALALAKNPVVNSCTKDGKSFTYNSSVNVSVAVAMDGGLITPVLQNADKIDIYSLSRTWGELVAKARSKSLSPAEYNTGTFTLSNLGMFGVDRFDAILPPGQGAIMAVGASKPTVVATADGMFGVKKQMQVNVTADHRIIYGAELASFLKDLAEIIENPKDLVM